MIGHVTNVDLTKYQGILLGGLFALIIASVVSIFIPALRNNLLIAYLGLFIFMIYTAFDIQRIKQFYYMTADGTDQRDKLAIYGALQLYLDFVNICLLYTSSIDVILYGLSFRDSEERKPVLNDCVNYVYVLSLIHI